MSALRIAAAQVHHEIEQKLADRVPGALTPRVRGERERLGCGVESLDAVLRGGLCVGAITELVGPECSGRTTMALAYTAAGIQRGNVAVWIDVEDRLDPVSAAETGVDWTRLLWVRCGKEAETAAPAPAPAVKTSEPTSAPEPVMERPMMNGGSPHPRSEGQGMPGAIDALLASQPRSGAVPDRRRNRIIGTPGAPNRPVTGFGPLQDREEQVPTDRRPSRRAAAQLAQGPPRQPNTQGFQEPRCSAPQPRQRPSATEAAQRTPMLRLPARQAEPGRPRSQGKANWTPLDQALRATDLLLQTGGFAVIVLDLGSTPAEMSWRIPLATWFRFRAACERTRTALVVLTRHPCARSSAAMVATLEPASLAVESRVVVGLEHRTEVQRSRFEQPLSNVVSIRRPPQPVRPEEPGRWKGAAAWAI